MSRCLITCLPRWIVKCRGNLLFAPAQSYTSYRNEKNKIAIRKSFFHMGTKINLIKSSFYFSSAFLEPTSWPDLEIHSTVALFNFINNFLLNILTRALVKKKNPYQSIKKWLFEKEITTISTYLEECTFLKHLSIFLFKCRRTILTVSGPSSTSSVTLKLLLSLI